MDKLMNSVNIAKPEEKYILMFKNIEVAIVNRRTGVVNIKANQYMPYSLYLEELDDIDTRVQNINNFDFWCADRLLSIKREYYKEIVNACGFTQATTDRQRAEVAIECRCLSLQDQYWIKKPSEIITWDEVSLFSNSLNDIFIDVCLRGKNMSITDLSPVIQNITVDGVIAKAWKRNTDGLYLLKAGSEEQVNKEVEASNILQQLGFNVVPYISAYWQNNPITMCKCFTNKDIGFVTAEAYGYNNNIDCLTDNFLEKFWQLTLSEYLIGNSDLHGRNWGFLIKDGDVVDMAPLFDFDHAFELDYSDDKLESKVWRTLGTKKLLKWSAAHACQMLGLKQEDFHLIKNQYIHEAVNELYCYIRKNI